MEASLLNRSVPEFIAEYQLMAKALLNISKVVKVNIWTWRSREGKKNIKRH